jgi:crotonobetaine/carnitine-CoA ligase
MIACDKSDWTIGKVLPKQAERYQDKTLVATREGQVTYEEMNALSNRFANGFLKLGLSKGDKVCLMLDNCLEHLYCWFGLGKVGQVDVPINTAYKGQILEYIINNSDAKALVVDQAYLDRIRFVEQDIRKIKQVIIYRPARAEKMEAGLKLKTLDLQEFFSFPETAPNVDVHCSDLATILYTSGTTGPSKGVMMSHAQCYFNARVVADNIGLLPDDVDYTCLPLFHGNARIMCTYPCILVGARVALAPRFSLSRFWEDIKFFKATVFNSLGAIGPLLFSTPAKPDDADNPARLGFLIPPPQNYKDFEKRFGLKVTTAYGMTEISLPIYSPLDQEMPEGSCGKVIPGFEVRIVNEYDDELPPGQDPASLSKSLVPYGRCHVSGR